MRVRELVAFIKEREAIRIKKESGAPRPWTKDSILDKYRFCNVHREDDRVTRWLRAEYYPKFGNANANIWFAAVVARLLNLPESLLAVCGVVVPWNPERFSLILHGRKQRREKNFNAAYIVSTNGVAMDKVDYLVERVLNPLWAARKELRPFAGQTLEDYHLGLMQFDGLGSFITAQVVADLKYMEPLKSASDWWTFAASGPGSRRGLNAVLDRSMESPWREVDWREQLQMLREKVLLRLPFELHAQDLQNCLCEFSKYSKVKLGLGEPKQLYHAKAS